MVFVFSLYQLRQAKIFFDSERIINELSDSKLDLKFINDNNLVFFGMSFNDSLSYLDMKEVVNFHKQLKNSSEVKRVFSIVNDRRLLNTGLFPIAKKVLNMSDSLSFKNSMSQIFSDENNFISKDGKKLLFLIENTNGLTSTENKNFINFLYSIQLNDNMQKVYVSGRSPSELYFSRMVIQEFIILTIISGFLCFVFLFAITKNLKLVCLTVFSVITSIVISLAMSQILFGGIELVMIITPAILFIVCLSDIMHLTNMQDNQNNSPKDFFRDRMNTIGKAVALTSITTAMSFLTFLFNDVLPILRFGIITSFGVLITLCIAMLVYAVSIDKAFYQSRPIRLLGDFTRNTISLLKYGQRSRVFHICMALSLTWAIYGLAHVKINNYLTDEINKKSEIYQQTAFFDTYFGGIKPLTVSFPKDQISDQGILLDIQSELKNLGFVIDFSNSFSNNLMIDQMGLGLKSFEKNYFFICRTNDEGSLSTLSKLNLLEQKFKDTSIEFNFSGAGYLFDLLANDLTKQLLFGLLLAILSIGIVFFIINGFDFNYFIIAVLPNITPIMLSIGILYTFGFYFSLSNAFIFTIVFGLIIDDSIHVISAYTNHIKNKVSKKLALKKVIENTGNAVIKTSIVVIICLFPLMFSEFKSVSQLSLITIVSAVIAVIFDLVYLPLIIKKLT